MADVTDGKKRVQVVPGQIWRDKDPRSEGRDRLLIQEIHGAYALVKNLKNNRCTKINLGRFVPRQTGYELVETLGEKPEAKK